jgi:hypothetical protein
MVPPIAIFGVTSAPCVHGYSVVILLHLKLGDAAGLRILVLPGTGDPLRAFTRHSFVVRRKNGRG